VTDSISTKRLLLRRWVQSDVVPFSQMNADPKVMHFFPSVMSPEQSAAFIERIETQFEERDFGLWVVEVAGKFAGFTGLNVTKFDTPIGPHVEIGWRLATWAWGKGYATEAAQAALRVGFEDNDLPEIFSFTSKTNLPSEAVMRRLGMQRRLDLDFDHPNTPGWWGQPHIVYQLTVAEWRKSQIGLPVDM
jgi:RimJ/RimL family protein N-acetyltransferase